MTFLTIAWCVVVFLVLNASRNISVATAMKVGFFTDSEIFSGRWYALITSAFVHKDFMHIFFNMYWLWILGPVVERQIGSLKFLGFILVTALISSGWQLATSHSGIGFSGVGYAIIGFGWIARGYYSNLKVYFNDQTLQIFAGWAVLCFFLDFFHIQNIANIAHVMGAASGALIALSFIGKKWLAQIGLAVVTVAAIVPVFYNPLSPEWNFMKAVYAHEHKNPKEAIRLYKRSLERDPTMWESQYNIALLELEQGSESGFEEALAKLRKINPAKADELMKVLLKPEEK